MALFKISKGNSENLPSKETSWGNGYAWFTQDDGKFYIDYYDGDDSITPLDITKKIRQPLNAYKADKADKDIDGDFINETYATGIIINDNDDIVLLNKDGNELTDDVIETTSVNTLDFDNVPTPDSINLLNSGTIYTVLQNLGDGLPPQSNATNGQFLQSNGTDASWATITTTDELVKQTAKTDNVEYKILMGSNSSPTSGTAYEAVYDANITINPSTHTITATNFAGNASSATKLGSTTVGGSTQPIYLSNGTATTCSTYAGGTAVTLNGTSKAASTASFYAPTGAGTSGQILSSNGSGAPSWISVATTYSSTGTTAISGTGVAAALGTLDVDSVGGGTGEYIAAISETNGKISATKATTTVSNTWTAGTSNGPTLSTTVNGITGTAVAIPSAAAGASGVVTTGAQQFDGNKTFKGHIYAQTNSTYSIGTSATRWNNGYFTSGYFGYYNDTSGGGVYLNSNAAQYGRWYVNTIGTASDGTTQGAQGEVYLFLGNSTARAAATETTGANNARGRIRFYSTSARYVDLMVSGAGPSSSQNMYIPPYNGAMYIAHTGGTAKVGDTNQPVYVAENGRITAITGSITNNTTGSAAKLTTGRTLKVSLGSTSASTAFDGSANITDIGVSGTLGIGNGGTGKTTWDIYKIVYASAANALGQLGHASSTSYLLKSGSSSAAPSWIQYTNSNTASTIVSRDASGNFAGGTITATTFTGNLNKKLDLTYDGTESTTNVSFNNSADITFSLAGFVRGVDDSSIVTPSGSYLTLSGGTMTGSLIASNATSTRQVRNITYSTSTPTSSDGQVGDIWLVYTS